MKNTVIFVLVVVCMFVGSILYLYRNEIKGKYNKIFGKVKDDLSHVVKDISEDIKG